ncbi:MAG TPA: MFS transporter [Xanthobacteraceae bacterium]|nr:MFS transporter [Xanthobacteraceae bacterium]
MYRLSPLARFAILYTVLYSAFGVVSPFLPAIFENRGLTAQEIAVVIGLGTAIRLVSGPLIGRLADWRRIWRGALSICSGGAGVIALAYLPAADFGAILVVNVLQSVLLAPLTPVADAMALSASLAPASKSFEYGWVRAAGSAAFIVGSIAAGQAAAAYGLVISIWLNAVLLVAAALAALPLPNIAVPADSPRSQRAADVLLLLQIRPFRCLLLVGALVLGSHALHDTFAVIRWREAGISTVAASLLWSESVIAEVVVFLFVGPLCVRRLGPAHAATLSAGAAVVRWTVLGATTQIVPLALVEPSHGLTFAFFHLGAMRLIGGIVPNQLAATAQALYGTLAVGLATALLTLASGSLYLWFEGRAFWVMALLCIIAMPLARGLAISQPSMPARQGTFAGTPR